jgi:hypothetical protein
MHDFIMPEFRGKDPKDYEFNGGGEIVRKDRWERAIHSIRYHLGDERRSFDVKDVVNAVETLVNATAGPPVKQCPNCGCAPCECDSLYAYCPVCDMFAMDLDIGDLCPKCEKILEGKT